MTAGWTEDRVGALKKLWLEGQSASQIAKQLGGGVTRNAVIGKVHRLGLSGRAAPSQPARATFRPSRPRPAAQPTQTPSAPRRIEAVQPRAAAVPSVASTMPSPRCQAAYQAAVSAMARGVSSRGAQPSARAPPDCMNGSA